MTKIRKLLSAFCIVSMLGGCAGDPFGGGTPGAPITFSDIIVDIQKAAVAACGFAPAGQVVAAILGASVPGVVAAAAVGAAICAAYAPAPQMARKGGKRLVRGWVVTPGAVNGVPIR